MVRIGELTFESSVNYGHKTISIVIPSDTSVSDIVELRAAELLEIVNDGVVEGSYRLVGWLRDERILNGILFTWQTVAQDEVDSIKQQVQTLQSSLNTTNVELSTARTDLVNLRNALQELADEIDAGNYSVALELLHILLGDDSGDEDNQEESGQED